MEVRGVRIQGLWSPPVAGLTACRAHLTAAGAVKLGQATASESVCGSKWGTRFLGFGRHLGVRTSATAGQHGVRTACARRRVLLVDDLVDSCP